MKQASNVKIGGVTFKKACSATIEGKTASRILERILLSTFKTEMGRNEPQSRGFYLEMREMTACRIVRGREPVVSDSSNTESRMWESWSANFLKNSLGNLSDPGDFPVCMDLIALISSLTEKRFVQIECSSVINCGNFYFSEKNNQIKPGRQGIHYQAVLSKIYGNMNSSQNGLCA